MSPLARRFSYPAFLIAALVAWPQHAAAQGESGNVCVRDYRSGAVCTANDVRIEALTVVSVNETCVAGTPGETEVVFETLVSSAGSPNRYDIGLFLALDGGSARDGDSCYHDFLSGALTATPTYGDKNMDMIDDLDGGPWWNGNTDGDSCGDLESNTQVFDTLPALRFACIDTNGDGSADVSVCSSWDNNTGSTCNTVVDAFPGTNSKCSCGAVELGIAPEPQITVVKDPAVQNVPSGGTASFTITVTSQTFLSSVTPSDPLCNTAIVGPMGDTNGDSILSPDETWTYTCTTTGVGADFTNTATVNATSPLGSVMDSDTANVVVSTASMTLSKSGTLNDANMDGFAQVGETISYSFTVTNTGTVALTNVSVTDPMVSPITCPSGNPIPMVGVGMMETCTGTYVITQADVDNGQKVNTATATSNETPPVMDSTTVPLPAPGMTLVKTGVWNDANMDGVAQAGETISYSFTVTNTGTIALTNVAVTDPMVSPITCSSGNPIPSLAVATMETCTGTYMITQADVDNGEKVNTATATSNETPPVMDSTTVTLPANPAMTLVKAGVFNDESMDGVAQVGETISYSFTVTNTGGVTLTNVSVTDPSVAPITCPSGNPIPSLSVGAMETCTGTYAIVQADVDAGQKANTATADSDQTPPVMDSTTVPLAAENPVIGVAKQVTSVTDVGGGQFDVAFSFVVENLGDVALSNVQVTDDLTATFPAPVTFAIQAGPAATGTLTANAGFNGAGDPNLLNASASSLAVGASATITVTVRITPNGAAGPFSNTVTASGMSPGGGTPTDVSDDGTDPDPNGNGDGGEPGENDPTPIVLGVAPVPAIDLVKTGMFNDESGDGAAQAGETIDYFFAVTNTGPVDLVNVAVSDPMVAPITCPSGNPIPLLAQGAMETCTGTYAVTAADVTAGQKTNVATAAGMDQLGTPASDTDSVTIIFGVAIPTLSEWGLLIFVLLLVGGATAILRRRSKVEI